MTSQITRVKLNDGTSIPIIGFGTGTAHFQMECTKHVVSALKAGYNYLDGAQMYQNSTSIRDALKQEGTKREDVYILTKCGMGGAKDGGEGESNPRTVLKQQLEELGADHVDMYLLHSPLFFNPLSLSQAWKIMEDLRQEGLTKSIGVSNFREEDILEMQDHWKTPPALNQLEFHPYVYHSSNMQRLLSKLKRHDIKTQAYGPLVPITAVPGGPVDQVVEEIAKKHDATASQVLIAWAAAKEGGCVVTTSRNPSRQTEQLEAYKVQLSQEEVDKISEAGKGKFYRRGMLDVWEKAKE